jgi:hypothetical protein
MIFKFIIVTILQIKFVTELKSVGGGFAAICFLEFEKM